ncbi:hypothetical protein CRM22_010972 [Opisthorchis felineus]|uniref:Tyrosine--tRNA ligase, cytoplasmic n=1 Tax=Opisthorchis felineus TaxID=147828 RepID=A0A4S2KGA9_OPIFE|nr:hypothetical protein CRM22_010972 [Opisthorchis felineus]
MKAPWSLLRYRTQYYEAVIKGMLKSVNVPLERLHFIRGADYELTEKYSIDVYRLMAIASVHDARKAGAEVVKQVSNPLVSGLLYPLLQALDEIHLGVDAQFGGVDQRKIFMLAEKYLPHLGHKKCVHLMNPMVPGLSGTKMSSSEADSKIDLLDDAQSVERKLSSAICAPGVSADQGNGVLAFLKYVVFPLTKLESGLLIPGHSRPYHDYNSLEADYLSGHVDCDALKHAVVKCLNSRMDVIRADFNTPEMAHLVEQAYPSSEANGLSNGVENLSVDSNEPTNGSSSGIPEKLSALEEQLAPIGDRSSLLSALREEFPDADDQLTACVRHVDRLRCLWSVTPTGLPHLGHSIPLRKLARLSQFDGVHIVILVNNVAAHLRGSCSWDLVIPRGEFCRAVLSALFIALGGRREQFTCLLGTDFQCSGDYMLEFYRLVSLVPESDCAAASDCPTSVAEQQEDDTSTNDPPSDGGSARCALGQLLMPCTDLVDTVYLRAHVRLASADRVRKRCLFEKGFLSKLTSQPAPVHLSHPLLSSLQVDSTGTGSSGTSVTVFQPMRSCPPASRTECPAAAQALAILAEDCSLPLVEPPAPGAEKTVLQGLKRRLKRAFCQPGNVAVNPVLELYRYVVLPDVSVAAPLIIPRSEKNGGPLHICSPDGAVDCASRWVALQTAFAQEILHPGDLKPAVELALSPANPEGVASRLLGALPPWPQLMQLLDAAFPQPVKQTTGKGKTKGKKGTNSGDGDAVCNGRSTAKGDAARQQTTEDTVDPNRLEIRVGRIITAKKHPDADSLYVEEVDFGPTLGHRIVISGLAGLYPLELLQGRCGAFVMNLKPVRMRGLESQAMLLCSSFNFNEPDSVRLVRPVEVPPDSVLPPGTRLIFHSPESADNVRQPDVVINPKTKLWERICPDLTVGSGDHVVRWKDWRLGTENATHWAKGSDELPDGAAVS